MLIIIPSCLFKAHRPTPGLLHYAGRPVNYCPFLIKLIVIQVIGRHLDRCLFLIQHLGIQAIGRFAAMHKQGT